MVKGLWAKLDKGVLIFDGAMGSMLQSRVSGPGVCLEELNLTEPGMLRDIHRAYVDQGVDVIETNTLGGNRIKLGEQGLGRKVEEINRQAVKTAREAASDRCLVALSVGSTGKFLEPVGTLTFDEATDVFREQIGAAAREGIDLVVVETISDLKEMRAAVVAAREVTSVSIMATMTFQEDGRTLLGTSPEAAAVCLESLGVDIIGANCGTGPEAMQQVLRELRRSTSARVVVQPNAGIPRLERGRTVFPMSPDEMASFYVGFVREGANAIGGCCGTTPQHMRAAIKAVEGLKPTTVEPAKAGTAVSSRSRVVKLGSGFPLVIIGERINPTGRKKLSGELVEGKLDEVLKEAREQVEAGADLLDVNVGAPGADEAGLMAGAVLAVQRSVAVPLVLDSADPDVLEAGLRAADGKVLINSVNGDKEIMDKILPLAVKYGAAVIGLTLDNRGIPHKADDRLKVAERILDGALGHGLPGNDLVIDPLTLSVSTDQELALETLHAVELIKRKLGLAVTLGVSNISFGLPERGLLNSAFLTMAVAAGLDGAIMNPKNRRMSETLHASAVIKGRDEKALRYIELYGGQQGEVKTEESPVQTTPADRLFRAVFEGHKESILSLVEESLQQGTDPLEMSDSILIPALEKVGRRFESKDFFLPQVMLSAEAAKIAFGRIKEALKGRETVSRGKIIMATVQGDIHDIGKNIVTMLLENHGFEVLDLGINVSPERIAEVAVADKVDSIGLSALMTTTMLEMGKTVEHLRGKGITCPVMVGGAAVTAEFAAEIGADAYGKNAVEAVNIARKLIDRKK